MGRINALLKAPRVVSYVRETSFLGQFSKMEILNQDYEPPSMPGYTEGNEIKIPEHELLGAVLSRALSDYVELNTSDLTKEANREMYEDLCDWFNSSSYEPFSFVWIICHLFGNPESVCRTIRQRIENITDKNSEFRLCSKKRVLYSMRRLDRIQPQQNKSVRLNEQQESGQAD